MNASELQAAALKVGISNYVGSAALAALGGAVALFTYISQNFVLDGVFYALMIAAALALVASIVSGGLGADDTVYAVANDNWHNPDTPFFNLQAVLTLVGLVLVIVATAVGATSPRVESPSEKQLEQVKGQVQALERQRATDAAARADLARRLDRLERRFRRLRP